MITENDKSLLLSDLAKKSLPLIRSLQYVSFKDRMMLHLDLEGDIKLRLARQEVSIEKCGSRSMAWRVSIAV